MKKLAAVALGCVITAGAYAETAGFQLSLTPDIAIQSRDTTIKGVSLGVWNENPGTQWQIGFVNGATGDSAGLQWLVGPWVSRQIYWRTNCRCERSRRSYGRTVGRS